MSQNLCIACKVDMGECNPRQYCGKWKCDNAEFLDNAEYASPLLTRMDSNYYDGSLKGRQIDPSPTSPEPKVAEAILGSVIGWDRTPKLVVDLLRLKENIEMRKMLSDYEIQFLLDVREDRLAEINY